jgi:hypothetical protein
VVAKTHIKAIQVYQKSKDAKCHPLGAMPKATSPVDSIAKL